MSTNLRRALQFKVWELSEQIAGIKRNNPSLQRSSEVFKAYKDSKREASIWLTALSLIKRNGDKMMTKESAVSLFRNHSFANHARKGKEARSLFYKAFRRLSRFNNKHKNSGFRNLDGFENWLKEKTQGVSHA